jgi:hypothetical protein
MGWTRIVLPRSVIGLQQQSQQNLCESDTVIRAASTTSAAPAIRMADDATVTEMSAFAAFAAFAAANAKAGGCDCTEQNQLASCHFQAIHVERRHAWCLGWQELNPCRRIQIGPDTAFVFSKLR